jgi:hypothetical protein
MTMVLWPAKPAPDASCSSSRRLFFRSSSSVSFCVPDSNGGAAVGICKRGQVSPSKRRRTTSIDRNASAPPIAATAASSTLRAVACERSARVSGLFVFVSACTAHAASSTNAVAFRNMGDPPSRMARR